MAMQSAPSAERARVVIDWSSEDDPELESGADRDRDSRESRFPIDISGMNIPIIQFLIIKNPPYKDQGYIREVMAIFVNNELAVASCFNAGLKLISAISLHPECFLLGFEHSAPPDNMHVSLHLPFNNTRFE